MVCIAPGQFISGPTGPPVCMLWGSKFPKRNIDVLLPGKKGRKQSGSNSHCVCHKGPACSSSSRPAGLLPKIPSTHCSLFCTPLLYPSSPGSCPAHSGTPFRPIFVCSSNPYHGRWTSPGLCLPCIEVWVQLHVG